MVKFSGFVEMFFVLIMLLVLCCVFVWFCMIMIVGVSGIGKIKCLWRFKVEVFNVIVVIVVC